MKKKLLLLYASYGTGHRSVCNYINEYFNNSGEYQVLSIDLLQYSMPVIGSLSKRGFERLILNHPYLWDVIYNFFDNRINSMVSNKVTLSIFDSKKIRDEIIKYNPDIVISTHFLGSELISKYNSKQIINSKLITIVTDYKAHHFWIRSNRNEDAIIVSSIEEKMNLVFKGFNHQKIKTFGMPISKEYVNNNYNRHDIRKKLEVKDDELLCVFYGGGGCGQDASIPFLKQIIEAKAKTKIIFVAGNNKELEHTAKLLVDKTNSRNITVEGFINNGAELLTACDYVITKPGGVTVTECLCIHCPMILLKIVGGQEKANCNYLTRNGYAKAVKRPDQLVNFIKKFETNSVDIKNMKNKMNKLEKKKSMEKLFSLANNLLR